MKDLKFWKRQTFSLAMVATLLLFLYGCAGNSETYFYVATDGNDDWSGQLPAPNTGRTDGPFASLTRAQSAIRMLKATGQFTGPITVMVRGGTYYLSQALLLGTEDSGAPGQLITYKAYQGEKPVLSGGKQITDWTPYRGKIMQSSLPPMTGGQRQFRQLFFDGKRQIRARSPNYDPDNPLYGGWAFIEAPYEKDNLTGLRYESGTFPRRWANPSQGEINIFPWKCWNNDIIPIKQVDRKRRLITLQRPILYHDTGVHPGISAVSFYGEGGRKKVSPGSSKPKGPPSSAPVPFMSLLAGNRFYVENLLEELDQPGEWYFDSEKGAVYFWPPSGSSNLNEVVIPESNGLIELRGSREEPVQHIKVSGFTLTQTLASFPRPKQPWSNHNYPNSGGHAILLENAEDCSIEDNFFNAVGGDAVRLQGYNARNRIVDNEIAYAGANGVCMVGSTEELYPSGVRGRPEELDWDRLVSERPKFIKNIISRNHIHHTGAIEKRGSGVYVFGTNSVDNVISHNLIHDIPQRGIMIQHGFGRNIVEYNEVRNVSLETSDTGGINTLVWYVYEADEDLAHGNIIRYNLVKDVIGAGAWDSAEVRLGRMRTSGERIFRPFFSWGIYLDWDPVDTTVYGNIVVGNVLGGIMMLRHARNNLIENNIFVDSSDSQMWYRSMSSGSYGNRFVRNIVYYSNPAADLIRIEKLPEKRIAESDYNLFFHVEGKSLVVDLPGVPPAESFDKWRELGYDTNSIIADPLFVDAANGDYSLKPESPAYGLGFKPIDVSRIGLHDHVCPLAP